MNAHYEFSRPTKRAHFGVKLPAILAATVVLVLTGQPNADAKPRGKVTRPCICQCKCREAACNGPLDRNLYYTADINGNGCSFTAQCSYEHANGTKTTGDMKCAKNLDRPPSSGSTGV